jgi:hypothetical protein
LGQLIGLVVGKEFCCFNQMVSTKDFESFGKVCYGNSNESQVGCSSSMARPKLAAWLFFMLAAVMSPAAI